VVALSLVKGLGATLPSYNLPWRRWRMEAKKGRRWTEKQKEGARDRALYDCHKDVLLKVVKNPRVLSVLEDPVKFQILKEMAVVHLGE
jgi:hypothetical protein